MVPSKEEWRKALEERHGKALQDKISATTVAICGLGGLGSNIAIALARAGIGKLVLIDYDRVDIKNLHRQQYQISQIGMFKTDALRENLQRIAPYTDIQIHNIKMNEKNTITLLQDVDLICEAFDIAEAKAMLVNTVLEELPEKYLIAASGMTGLGDANEIKTRRISKHFYVCGDETSDVNEGIGLVSSRVMICAAHQAHAVLQILAAEV